MNNDFMIHAACRNHPNPDLWFPERGTKARDEAIRICASCPVQLECKTWAEVKDCSDGIWAGRPVSKKPKSPRILVHGTEAGWRRHRRHKQKPCASCEDAHIRAGQDRWRASV